MTTERDTPQIYLVTPPDFDLGVFPDQLASCLDRAEVACVRLALATRDEDSLARAADALRAVTADRDIALVIDTHLRLARAHGLDGLHLTDGARSVRAMRRELGEDAILGAYCGQSRHDGLNAAELGADYVAFGPAGENGLGDGRRADLELFEWWSQMIEVPIVAEGALSDAVIHELAPFTDFFAIGEEVWRQGDPAGELARLAGLMR